jgi:hypothetical protein
MAYEKQNFIPGQKLKAAQLNHMEDGIADAGKFLNFAEYGLPVLYLMGVVSAMTKDNEVSLGYVYGDRNGTCKMKWQGSSSLSYPKKNYTIKFDNAFEAVEGWGEQKKYCLKANFIDHSHARNVVSAKLWGQIVKSRKQRDIFDINKCTGLVHPSSGVLSGTAPVDGVITSTNSVYADGLCWLGGHMYPAGVYRISADVYITSSNENEVVYIGLISTSDTNVSNYSFPSVVSGSWQRVESIIALNADDAGVILQIGGGSNMPSIKIKNISVSRCEGSNNLFDTNAVTGFVGQNG